LASSCPGWYFANGDRYPLASPQGQTLFALPENHKKDWGIAVTVAGGVDVISLPNMFHTDGRGFFMRAGKTPGAISLDTMRRITGVLSCAYGYFFNTGDTSGAFSVDTLGLGINQFREGTCAAVARLDSGRLGSSYNGSETTPLHIGMTPAIFLGV
jgi:hypothetical protein